MEATAVADGARDAWTATIGDSPDTASAGRVLRVFDRTAYLAFEDGDRPRVLLLGTPTVRHGPLLVRTDTDPGFTFSGRIEPGDDCRVRPTAGRDDGYVLSVGPTLEVAIPRDLLDASTATSGRIYPLAAIDRGGPIHQRSRGVLQGLQDAGVRDGLGWLEALDGTIAQPRGHHVQAVTETWIALLAQDQPHTTDLTPLTRLVGLGPGATPSGDDILSGILYTLMRTTTGSTQDTVKDTAERLTERSTDATTLMSLALLEQAAHSRAPAAVENCLTTLLAAEPADACRDAADAVTAIGHHSGADALAGILATLLHIAPRIDDRTG